MSARRQDREVVGHVLAGRDPLLVRFGAPAPSEASGRGHDPLPSRGSGVRGPPQLSAVFPNIKLTSLRCKQSLISCRLPPLVRSFNIRGLDRGQAPRIYTAEANMLIHYLPEDANASVEFESSTWPPYRVIFSKNLRTAGLRGFCLVREALWRGLVRVPRISGF